MGLQFLSSEWFEEAERLRAKIDPPVPEAIAKLVINLNVTAGPSGDIRARMEAGRFVTGHPDEAPTTLSLPYDVARPMFTVFWLSLSRVMTTRSPVAASMVIGSCSVPFANMLSLLLTV